jgi:acetone carboxylase gamma subunit
MSDVTTDRPPIDATGADGPGVGDAFTLRVDDAGVQQIACAECGHEYGPAANDPKLGAVMSERSIADLSRLNEVGMVERLVARHFYCPSCALLFAVNVQQRGDPIMLEWSIRSVAE